MTSGRIYRERLFRFAAGLILSVVLAASFVPSSVVSLDRWNLGHILAYLLLTVASVLALPIRIRSLPMIVGMAISLIGLGLIIELLQPLVGRTTSIVDFTFNAVGVMFGVAVCAIFNGLQMRSVPRA